MCVDLSLGFLFCSIDLYFCLCASTILSWWLWLCSRAWSQAGWFLQFHSSFSRLLWLFKVFLYFHTNCEIICSSSVKNTIGSLMKVKSLSCVRLFGDPVDCSPPGPPSMGFSRQEYWSGWPFPSPGDLPDPGIEPRSPALQTRHFTLWAIREVHKNKPLSQIQAHLHLHWTKNVLLT